MARKKESILDILVLFPWWLILIITVLLYVTLTYIVPAFHFENLVFRAFAYAAPKVAPLISIILIVVVAVSAINQLRKGKMLESQSGLDSIRNLSWREFEELVGEAFRRKGYRVLENPGDGADGGVDLRLRKNGKVIFVQCKHWKARRVGVKVVRELYGVMMAKKVSLGIIVTSGDYTEDARQFANDKPIQLIPGKQLLNLIAEGQNSGNICESNSENVICPKCGSDMVLRVAKKGKYAGQKFWGCSKYPNCRGILAYKA